MRKWEKGRWKGTGKGEQGRERGVRGKGKEKGF